MPDNRIWAAKTLDRTDIRIDYVCLEEVNRETWKKWTAWRAIVTRTQWEHLANRQSCWFDILEVAVTTGRLLYRLIMYNAWKTPKERNKHCTGSCAYVIQNPHTERICWLFYTTCAALTPLLATPTSMETDHPRNKRYVTFLKTSLFVNEIVNIPVMFYRPVQTSQQNEMCVLSLTTRWT